MDDSVPTEDKIEKAVKRLKNNCSGGPSGMRAEHLKGCLAASRKKDREEAAAEQENPTEETTAAGSNRTGGRGD